MPMLHGRLTLTDKQGTVLVEDAEAFCADILRKRNLNLTHHQQERLLAYLVTEAWKLSNRYQSNTIRFTTWATITLKHRITDWLRSPDAQAEGLPGRTRWQFNTHTYHRPGPQHIPLDELGASEPIGHLDATTHRSSPELIRILTSRTRLEAWQADQLDTETQGEAA